MQESLGGNTKTTLMIAASPHPFNVEETIGTLMFGYPIWTEMRRRVQAARIDSIMKGQ